LKSFLTAITTVLVLTSHAASADGWVTQAEVDDAINGDTCKHYVNRARFKHRNPNQEFVVTLADGCLSAKLSLKSDNQAERAAAHAFLTRLRVLRDTIIEMNMERAFGKSYEPRTRISYGVGSSAEPLRRVSALGEYMIAREMGLLAVYRAWLGTGPELAGEIPSRQ
ncbi:MAG: hypothetical protein AAF479_14840, partial [Pseudomonadota bacterium]